MILKLYILKEVFKMKVVDRYIMYFLFNFFFNILFKFLIFILMLVYFYLGNFMVIGIYIFNMELIMNLDIFFVVVGD